MLLTAYAINGRDTGVNALMFLLDASEPLCEGLKRAQQQQQRGLGNKTRHRRRDTVVGTETNTRRSLANEMNAYIDDSGDDDTDK